MILFQLIDFMNLFHGNLDERFKKFQVYDLPTMGVDDFMVYYLIFNIFILNILIGSVRNASGYWLVIK